MFASWPSISPDGTEVVFVSRPPGGLSNIFKLHIATRKIERLTDEAESNTKYNDLDWSPDRRQILFIKRLRIPNPLNREKTVLCVMDMKTRDIRHILQPDLSHPIFHPSWSPDSEHILYLQFREIRKDAGLFKDVEWFIPTMFITDDNGNNAVEVKRDDLGNIPEGLSPVSVPTWSPSRSQIAYISSVLINPPSLNPPQIYSMNLDDGGVTALTSGGAPMAWRPDGQKILFTFSGDICVMDPDGENVINLTQSPQRESTATWSPDGKQIAFTRYLNEEDLSIFVMDANGQNQQRLTFEPGTNIVSHWSPDGGRIAFLSYRDGSRRIYTMDENGQNVQAITHGQREFDSAPAWSPDGNWLAFGSGDGRSWGIYLIDPQGRNETRVFHSHVSQRDGTGGRPAWSPDGQHLVFIAPWLEAWSEGGAGLIKIRVDGGMPTYLKTEELIQWRNPVWSPDGNNLLFNARENRRSFVEEAIFFMLLDTSKSCHFILPGIIELISESDFELLRLVWGPDGSQLMLSIGPLGRASRGEGRLYLIDIASETARLWMDDAAEADWVRPGFVYAVNPRGKHIATWA